MALLIILLQVLVPVSIVLIFARRNDSMYFMSQPVVGLQKQRFAWLWAAARSLYKTREWAFDGYVKYSKIDSPYIIPTIDRGPMVVIPPRHVKELYALPETVLDVRATQQETNQTRWVAWDKEAAENRFVFNVIRQQLTRNLKELIPVTATEIEHGFERWWGIDTEWKEINIWDSCWGIITGAVNGGLCGAPLCRNVVKDRLENTAKFKADPNYRWTPPVIAFSPISLSRQPRAMANVWIYGVQRDVLQWIIDECYATGNLERLDPTNICYRLLLLNDVSLPSTAFSVQNLITDLFTTDPSLGFVDALRVECEAVFEEAGGIWTADALKKLKLVESAIRESMRLSPLGVIALPRTIVHKDGISLENSQASHIHIPHGAVVTVPIEPIHYDEDIYPDAKNFNAFRFAQPDDLQKIVMQLNPKKGERGKVALVNLDEAFLGFGIGRHICPARFFALAEMKIFVADMLLNYDIEYLKAKPALVDMVWLKVPWNSGSLRVRRRNTFGNSYPR
ncbi:hypothetical protein FQN57_007094 [Myotisia sp. PD_48]|nr:hypothetical protein FQN57_007094 [Myotisia sp. PD_48]